MTPDDDAAFPEAFFQRQDESDDALFYSQPRFVTHIDDVTIAALTAFYGECLQPEDRVLDLMSSWVSHLPESVAYRHVAGVGMNAEELRANPRLDRWLVQDLNHNPVLPFDDAEFDAVLIAVSIQYLVRPLDVFAQIARVLAPGGRCVVAMSHRLFPTKAIRAFHVLSRDQRFQVVSEYMRRGGGIDVIETLDRSPLHGDPLWIVTGTKGPDAD